MSGDPRGSRPPGRAGGAARIAAAAAAVAAVLPACAPPPDPPSVVLIIVDTLRRDRLGAYGFPGPASPALDRMAERGVRFDRVIAQSSWTRPSIGSLLTSRYPRTLGIYDEREGVLPDDFPTLAEILHEAGYTTLGATANPNVNSGFNFQQGFDHYVDSDVLFRWMRVEGDTRWRSAAPLPSARQIFDGLLAQVRRRPAPPYYLQATLMEVHEFRDRRLELDAHEAALDPAPYRRYAAAVRLVSEEIERFVAALSERPGFERTLFVVTSDHGEGLADHKPVRQSDRHGFVAYESQVLVPLILYATDDSLPRGRVVREPVRLLDLVPTLLDLLGIEPPPGLAGRSLRPAIEGEGAPDLPATFVTETQFRYTDVVAAYGPDWKYFEHREPLKGTDPRELQAWGVAERGSLTNRLAQHPEAAARLRRWLREWEQTHPRARPGERSAPLDPSEEEQLRSIGYLE